MTAAQITISKGTVQESAGVQTSRANSLYTDGNYFSVFPHQWLAGNPADLFEGPTPDGIGANRWRRRYFPGLSGDQAVGKTVIVNDSIPMVVSGVVKIWGPAPTSIMPLFFRWRRLQHRLALKIYINGMNGALPLRSISLWCDYRRVLQRLPCERQILHQIFTAHSGRSMVRPTAYRSSRSSDIHFNLGLEGKADKSTLVSLSLLAVFILLLGSINFINLTTAQASERAKEIGMRKILGSSKGQLIARSISETVLLTTVATVLFPVDHTPADQGLQRLHAGRARHQAPLAAACGTFHAGPHRRRQLFVRALPGACTHAYQTADVTRNYDAFHDRAGIGASGFGRRLTVSQFVIAQVLIIGVLVINSQIRFAVNKDMGFRKDAVINFYVPIDWAHR